MPSGAAASQGIWSWLIRESRGTDRGVGGFGPTQRAEILTEGRPEQPETPVIENNPKLNQENVIFLFVCTSSSIRLTV